MDLPLKEIEPQSVWHFFSEINAIPRASKKETQICNYIKAWAKARNLNVSEDKVGNILVKKPATAGMETRQTTVLQAHLDMVHQKNNDTVFDFDTQGIAMYLEGDWVRAKGTTLGADNGLGAAAILAILDSKTITHPPLEALFTIDEETGMTGALELQTNWLTGTILLNLDTEEDNEISIGCAGGIDVTATQTYIPETCKANAQITLGLCGLKGGHSGMDIHKGLGNANKIMAEILTEAQAYSVHLISFQGGSLRNAIPREATIVWAIEDNEAQFLESLKTVTTNIKARFKTIEPDLHFSISRDQLTNAEVLPPTTLKSFTNMLNALHNGVYLWSDAIPDLVEASNNVSRVQVNNGTIQVECLTRSSVEASKMQLVELLSKTFNKANMQVTTSGNYPGWAPNFNGEFVKLLSSIYTSLFNEAPFVSAGHAGLECGIIGARYPQLTMASIGPTIKGAHSPDERASVKSTQKFWKFLKAILAEIPEA